MINYKKAKENCERMLEIVDSEDLKNKEELNSLRKENYELCKELGKTINIKISKRNYARMY